MACGTVHTLPPDKVVADAKADAFAQAVVDALAGDMAHGGYATAFAELDESDD